MSDSTRATSAGYGPIKTLTVRLSEDVRAQLDIIARLNDRTVTDEIRLAIEAWIERTTCLEGSSVSLFDPLHARKVCAICSGVLISCSSGGPHRASGPLLPWVYGFPAAEVATVACAEQISPGFMVAAAGGARVTAGVGVGAMVVGLATETGRAIWMLGHTPRILAIASCSAGVTQRGYLALTSTWMATYWQRKDLCGGSQVAASTSPFASLVAPSTARSSAGSFANSSRSCSVICWPPVIQTSRVGRRDRSGLECLFLGLGQSR